MDFEKIISTNHLETLCLRCPEHNFRHVINLNEHADLKKKDLFPSSLNVYAHFNMLKFDVCSEITIKTPSCLRKQCANNNKLISPTVTYTSSDLILVELGLRCFALGFF